MHSSPHKSHEITKIPSSPFSFLILLFDPYKLSHCIGDCDLLLVHMAMAFTLDDDDDGFSVSFEVSAEFKSRLLESKAKMPQNTAKLESIGFISDVDDSGATGAVKSPSDDAKEIHVIAGGVEVSDDDASASTNAEVSSSSGAGTVSSLFS